MTRRARPCYTPTRKTRDNRTPEARRACEGPPGFRISGGSALARTVLVIQAEIDALKALRSTGVESTSVSFGDRTTTTRSRSLVELESAIAALEAELAALLGLEGVVVEARPRRWLGYGSKGT